MTGFAAARQDADAVLTWTTSGPASDLAGFHVYREMDAGGRERITDGLLDRGPRFEFVDPAAPPAATRYWLEELSRSGERNWHGPAVLSPAGLPARLRLAQNTPNPFRSDTRIAFSLPTPGPVSLRVFDSAGREVAVLVRQRVCPRAITR